MKTIFSFSIFLLLLSACLPARTDYPRLAEISRKADIIIIKDVNVFTGRDSFLLQSRNVLIQNGKIAAVSDAEIVADKARVINGSGKTLMPGLVDTHVHVTSTPAAPWDPAAPDLGYNLEAFLYAGVTTIYDLGGPGKKIEKLKKKMRKGKIPGPDIFHTHKMITVHGSHPIPSIKEVFPVLARPLIPLLVTTIEDTSEVQHILKNARKAGADYIKIVCDEIPQGAPEMPVILMKSLVAGAHRKKLKVFAHVGSKEDIFRALEAGVDVLAHGPYKSVLSEEDARKIAAYNKPVIYTLSGFNHVNQLCHGEYQPAEMDSLMVPPEILNSYVGDKGKDISSLSSFRSMGEMIGDYHKYYRDNIRLLQNAGVKILAGTDSPMLGVFPGSSLHNELQQLNEAGIPAWKVLMGTTSDAARLFIENPDFGTIEPGKKASMILLNGDPLKDINATREIVLVLKDGKIIDRLR